jgi:hypothetical protein
MPGVMSSAGLGYAGCVPGMPSGVVEGARSPESHSSEGLPQAYTGTDDVECRDSHPGPGRGVSQNPLGYGELKRETEHARVWEGLLLPPSPFAGWLRKPAHLEAFWLPEEEAMCASRSTGGAT